MSDRVLGSDAAVAVGRFSPDGPKGYRAKDGGPLRATRVEAEYDQRRRFDLTVVTGEDNPDYLIDFAYRPFEVVR
jgi:hypothetical protein